MICTDWKDVKGFNTRLREEANKGLLEKIDFSKMRFNIRLREEANVALEEKLHGKRWVSIHASVRRRTPSYFFCIHGRKVSIHASVRRRTYEDTNSILSL